MLKFENPHKLAIGCCHAPTTFSLLVNTAGVGIFGCEDQNEYSLLNGQPFVNDLPCGLKEYRVESGGYNTLLISN